MRHRRRLLRRGQRLVEGQALVGLVGVAELVERRQRILDRRRLQRQRARLDALAEEHTDDEDEAGSDGAAEKQEEDLAPVERDLDFVLPPIQVAHG